MNKTALALLLGLCTFVAADWDPNRLHFVDAVERPDGRQNYLFRGNVPVVDDEYQWGDLQERIQTVALEEAGFDLPPGSYYFFDLSFLNVLERKYERVRRQFWEEHLDEGETRTWVLTGALVNPSKLSEKKRVALAKKYPSWSLEKLPQRIEKIQDMLPDIIDSSGEERPVVVHAGCRAGRDRTGAFMASYRMAAQGLNWREAIGEADDLATRPIRKASRYAAAWYCLYLKHGPEERDYLDCTGGGLDDDDDDEIDEGALEDSLALADSSDDPSNDDQMGPFSIDPFDPQRVHFLDFDPESKNWLFRTNIHLTKDKDYAYDEAIARMREVAKEEGPEGYEFPDDPYLLDITLISPLEVTYLARLRRFWKENPDKGELKWWPLTGTPKDPWKMKDDAERAARAADMPSWNKEKLIDRVESLGELLATAQEEANGREVVMSIFCHHGTDRTGELAAAYQMRYLGWSWAEALDYGNHVNKDRPMLGITRNSAAWYCLYLKHGAPGMDIDCNPGN